MTFGSATAAFRPFSSPLPVPDAGPTDGDLVVIKCTSQWASYLAGAAYALCVDSSWAATSLDQLNQVRKWAWQLIHQIQERTPDIPIQFRVNPIDNQNWQYSLDAGVHWLDGPDTAANYTAQFAVSGTSPAGQKITLNNGETYTDLPPLVATDPHAVVTNPLSTAENTVSAAANVLLTLEASGTATGIELAATADTVPALLSLLALL